MIRCGKGTRIPGNVKEDRKKKVFCFLFAVFCYFLTGARFPRLPNIKNKTGFLPKTEIGKTAVFAENGKQKTENRF